MPGSLKTKTYFLLLLFFYKAAPAQHPDIDFVFSNPVFQNYTMKNGLASNYCYDVLQDKRGYIWVATLNGLSRFNGNKWQIYQQQSANPNYRLPANWVMDIDEDRDGNIWINTDRGIARYDFRKDSIYRFTNPPSGWGKVVSVDSSLYVSSWTGIDRYRIGSNVLVLRKHYTPSERNSFLHLFKDRNQQIWACPEDNPVLMSIESLQGSLIHHQTINLNGTQQSVVVNSIAAYTNDTLLLNTKSRGILKYCVTDNTATEFLAGCFEAGDEISCSILYELKGVLFLLAGTKNNGLYNINIRTHKVFHYKSDHNDPGSILSDGINAIYADNNQGLWIATGKGLSFFHPSLQKNKYYYFYNNPVVPPGIQINTVYKINDNDFLIGTDAHGLFLHHGITKMTEKIAVGSAGSIRITSFCRITPSEILVATNKGLYVYSIPAHQVTLQTIAGKPFMYNLLNVKSLGDRKIGLCTYSGVMLYDLKHQQVIYTELSDTSREDERKISKDLFLDGDHLWVLRLFNGYQRHQISTKNISEFTPKDFAGKPVDYHGFTSDLQSLYVSTSRGIIIQGLQDPGRVEIIQTAQGLQGDEIENAFYFSRSRLYYTTPEGLYFFDPAKKAGKRVVSYENYPQKWYNQLAMSDDSLLICTVSDYFMINDPLLDFRNNKQPAYNVEQVLVNGKPLNTLKDTLVLAHHQNNIVIRLAGLVYPESEKNTWYFKLNKLDTLQHSVANGEVVLNNLPPDDYVLTIYSVNNEGTMSPGIKQLYITINKPFYNTWWFYMLLLVLVGVGLYLPFVYRKAQKERLLKIRNQISRDLHDELGANVSSIHIMANMLLNRRRTETDDPALVNISKYSVQISDTINDIVWNINPKFDSVDELIKKMIRYASESLEASQINYKVELPKHPVNVEIDNEFKYHLYLLFKEAINNAAKYSRANLVHIAVNFTNHVFSFSVKDNGTGFDINEADKGNGLYNMRSRAKEIGASLEIHSEKGRGTEIHLTVKLK